MPAAAPATLIDATTNAIYRESQVLYTGVSKHHSSLGKEFQSKWQWNGSRKSLLIENEGLYMSMSDAISKAIVHLARGCFSVGRNAKKVC